MVIEIPEDVEDPKAYIEDKYIVPLIYLENIESEIETYLEGLSKAKLDIENMFE